MRWGGDLGHEQDHCGRGTGLIETECICDSSLHREPGWPARGFVFMVQKAASVSTGGRGVDTVVQVVSIRELSVGWGGVARRGCRWNLLEAALHSAPGGFSLSMSCFLVLMGTHSVGAHRCRLISPSLHCLRLQCLYEAWIYTSGKMAGFSNNNELGIL